jgi:hypothetical protein
MIRAIRWLLLLAALAPIAGAAAQEATPAAGDTLSFVGGNAAAQVPEGERGKVSVVLSGPYFFDSGDTYLPFVVRNDMAETIYDVNAAVAIRDENGNLFAAGDATSIGPYEIQHG